MGTDNFLFHAYMARLNRSFLDWDVPFRERGLDAEAEVRAYCQHWGVPVLPWVWSKAAAEYSTMNEWFMRAYAPEHAPEANLGDASIVAPATAVVSWFPSSAGMSAVVKNEAFSAVGCGLPADFLRECAPHPCALHYLAPADYHAFHAPVAGRVTHCELLGLDRYSVTVKPYIWSCVNILRRNRRAVITIEPDSGKRVGLVVIGGVTVDSIRLDPVLRVGTEVAKGARLGAFARGGSSIATFFTCPVELVPACAAADRGGRDFKLDCGRDLAAFSDAVS